MTPDVIRSSSRVTSSCSGFSVRSGGTQQSIKSTCRICLSTLENPAKLSCGHRFCECCLDEYWRTREKPVYIVCPLCRGNAFNVYFSKEGTKRTDFHRLFEIQHSNEVCNTIETGINKTLICLKLSVIAPFIYFLGKYLRPVLVDGYHFFQYSLGYGYKL